MATIKFLLISEQNPASIYVRLIDGRKCDFKVKTNFIINPSDWSVAKQKPKSLKNIDLKKLDSDLENLRSSLLKHYNNSQNEIINLKWLKDFINPVKSDIPDGLILYFDYYLKLRVNELTLATRKKINVVKNKLISIEKLNKKCYLVKNVNLEFKKEFENYNIIKGYASNTISENLKEIKTICRHAAKNGIELSPLLNDIVTAQVKAVSIYFTFEELDSIEKTALELDYLQNARDWLVISCYTAQRVSDFMRFKSEMIREQDGKKLIEFTQQKTGKIMTLPLHPKVIEILQKRNGQFPRVISSQKYNDYIKEVAKISGINEVVFGGKKITIKTGEKILKKGKLVDELITRKKMGDFPKHELVTSHIGRRSFATNFYGKIPTSLLIAATGHETEKMFLVYIGKSDSDKALQLADYF